MLKRTAIILALGLAAGGCSTIDVKPGDTNAAREDLKNVQGHVIGYKEVARDDATGEELTQISLLVPRLGSRGQLIGYEERVRGGTVLRDLYGKRVGGRFLDLRSRGSNPRNKGLTIEVSSRKADQALSLAVAPSIEELMLLAGLAD